MIANRIFGGNVHIPKFLLRILGLWLVASVVGASFELFAISQPPDPTPEPGKTCQGPTIHWGDCTITRDGSGACTSCTPDDDRVIQHATCHNSSDPNDVCDRDWESFIFADYTCHFFNNGTIWDCYCSVRLVPTWVMVCA